MIRRLFAAVLGVFLISTPAWSVEYQVPPGGLHVEDGDTVLIVIDGEQQRVQLAGIDAPEDTDNPKLQRDMQRTGLERERLLVLGQLSREYLRRLTKIGAPYALHYEPERRDRYGRLSGEVRDNRGNSLADTLVSGGYAIASRDGSERLRKLQDEAQREKSGLWGLEPEATALWAGVASN